MIDERLAGVTSQQGAFEQHEFITDLPTPGHPAIGVEVSARGVRSVGGGVHPDAELDPLVIPSRYAVQHNDKGGLLAVESHQVVTVGFSVCAGWAHQPDVAQKKLEVAHLETTF